MTRLDLPQPDLIDADSVLTFWRNAGPSMWFARNEAFDVEIRDRFQDLHMKASRNELAAWEAEAEGSLALLVLLDQFPRNMYRGSAHAFATDPLARRIAHGAIAAGHDRTVERAMRFFFYMPLEHAEDPAEQARAVALFEQMKAETGEPGNLPWAIIHRDIIARFGRFPHRNLSLGRASTPQELTFLAEGGFSG